MPWELAALGTVLCLYQGRSGGELAGWSRAMQAEASSVLDSDGMRECLLFRDAAGDCCWKLYLLPDSDFLAWERLSSGLPMRMREDAGASGIAERMLQRLVGRVRDGEWQASVVRLHALPVAHGKAGECVLAATLASVSPLGAAAARGIARSQHADAEALRDECCCARAAREAMRLAAAYDHESAHPYPLVRLPRPGRD